MAARRVQGEQLLPGDPENLLRPSRDRVRRDGSVAEYLALSVTVDTAGVVSVRKLRMDESTRRVVPVLLDQFDPAGAEGMHIVDVLRHWAQEVAVAERSMPL